MAEGDRIDAAAEYALGTLDTAERLAFEAEMARDPALAREVEAWSRAGDAARAHDRAEEYVTKFPSGRRLKSVRRLGAIE